MIRRTSLAHKYYGLNRQADRDGLFVCPICESPNVDVHSESGTMKCTTGCKIPTVMDVFGGALKGEFRTEMERRFPALWFMVNQESQTEDPMPLKCSLCPYEASETTPGDTCKCVFMGDVTNINKPPCKLSDWIVQCQMELQVLWSEQRFRPDVLVEEYDGEHEFLVTRTIEEHTVISAKSMDAASSMAFTDEKDLHWRRTRTTPTIKVEET